MEIANQAFFVTGASGAGEGTARMLAANGAHVVIVDLQTERGQALTGEPGGTFIKCDVRREADGQAEVAAVAAAGKTNMVNLAGSFNMIHLAAEAGCRHQHGRHLRHDAADRARPGVQAHPQHGVAPGIFGTPMLFGMPQKVQDAVAASVPFPSHLGTPADYPQLVKHVVENDMLNGEMLRLGWASRLAPE